MNRDKDIVWAAGLLEGEGCFSTRHKGLTPRIACEMTDEDVILKLQNIFGGSVNAHPARKANWKPTWKWLVYGAPAANVMKLILPCMGSRRSAKILTILADWEVEYNRKETQHNNKLLAAKDYLESGDSLREVAKRHNMSYESVRRATGLIV